MSEIKTKGRWEAVCYHPDGSVAWREGIDNAAVAQGLNDLLSDYFNAGTQRTQWFAGLIDSSGFSSLQASDTLASHGGWLENTSYSQGNRQQWVPNAPAGGIMGGATIAFTISASVTIRGAFLASDNTKGGTSGILWATGLFSSPQTLVLGQVLAFTYTVTLTATS